MISGVGPVAADGPHDYPHAASDPRAVTLALLARRAPGATVCPSEVARALAAAAGDPDWRGRMAAVHAAVDDLIADGAVGLSWQGTTLPARAGPYRIGRGPGPTR